MLTKEKKIDLKMNGLLFVFFDYLKFLSENKKVQKEDIYKGFLNLFIEEKKIESTEVEFKIGGLSLNFVQNLSLSKMNFEQKSEFIEFCFSKVAEDVDLTAFELCRQWVVGQLNDFQFFYEVKEKNLNIDLLPKFSKKIYIKEKDMNKFIEESVANDEQLIL